MSRPDPRVPVFLVLLVALACAASGLLGVPVTSADDLADAQRQHREITERIAQQQQTLEQLDAAQTELQDSLYRTADSLKQINAELDAVRRDVAHTRTLLDAAQRRYAALVAELKHLDWTLSLLDDEIRRGEADLGERRTLLGKRLDESYRTQQTSLLQQVFSADSFADALADSASYLELGNQDVELARQIERDQASLDALERSTDVLRYKTDLVREDVGHQAARLAAKRQQLEAAQARLNALEARTRRFQKQQLAEFRSLARTKQQAAALLKSQVAAQASLKVEIDRIIYQQLHAGNIPSEYTGTFQWPMIGDISQEFGCTGFEWEPPLGDCAHFHKGIDVVAPDDSPFHAAADGVVVFVGFNPYDKGAQAWIVIVAHSGSLFTWYAHGQPRAPEDVYPGARVKQGQVIGYQGSTGRSTGAHLHWAVQLGGQFVNPRLFL